MNLEKVVFAFFIVLAATLNFGFFIGDIDDPSLHHLGETTILYFDIINDLMLKTYIENPENHSCLSVIN